MFYVAEQSSMKVLLSFLYQFLVVVLILLSEFFRISFSDEFLIYISVSDNFIRMSLSAILFCLLLHELELPSNHV